MNVRRVPPMIGAVNLLASLLAVPACAHAILMASMPPVAGVVAAGPLSISMRYNSLIDTERSRVVLVAPDRGQTTLAIRRSGAGDTIAATTSVQPGHYVLRWQVLAIDGHITRGEVPFDVGRQTAAQGSSASGH